MLKSICVGKFILEEIILKYQQCVKNMMEVRNS